MATPLRWTATFESQEMAAATPKETVAAVTVDVCKQSPPLAAMHRSLRFGEKARQRRPALVGRKFWR